jgi:hypothetical protein
MTAAEPGALPGTGDAELTWHRPSRRLLRRLAALARAARSAAAPPGNAAARPLRST